MAVPFSNTKLRVPRGFQNILEGLAREVLRSQPENVYKFGTMYFENLLRVREEGGIDPTEHGSSLEDRFYNNDSFSSPGVDAGDPQQQAAAMTIQTKYRQHAAKQEVDHMRDDEAAVRIQAGFRGYKDRQKIMEMKDPEEYEKRQHELETRLSGNVKPSAADDEEEVDIDLNDPEVEKAAVKIQAGFKGYRARKDVQDVKEGESQTNNVPDNEPGDQPGDQPETSTAPDSETNNTESKVSDPETQSQEPEKPTEEKPAEEKPTEEKPKEEEEEMPDLTDKGVQDVTAKLQKGFMSRKKKK